MGIREDRVLQKQIVELARLGKMIEFEKNYRQTGYRLVCGVDEAGRGPLAGPVFAAAVILPEQVLISGLNDSKKLSASKREYLFDKIKEVALCYAVETASVGEIEEINILRASLLAMKRAILKLSLKPEAALIDGNFTPEIEGVKTYPVVGGDGKSVSIAAASILAKVSRDRLMCEIAKKYPEYGFDRHKGYGTKAHISAIKEFGSCEIHRKSFLKEEWLGSALHAKLKG